METPIEVASGYQAMLADVIKTSMCGMCSAYAHWSDESRRGFLDELRNIITEGGLEGVKTQFAKYPTLVDVLVDSASCIDGHDVLLCFIVYEKRVWVKSSYQDRGWTCWRVQKCHDG